MLEKTLNYKDFNDQDVEGTFYFNLTDAEVTELNIREDLKAVGQSGNANRVMDTFKRILKAAYGIRLAGGAKFVKTEQDWDEFVSGRAYSQIFMQLVTDADYATAFIRELIPAEMAAAVDAQDASKSPSEAARAASEANMQGYNSVTPSQPIIQSNQSQSPQLSYPSRREAMENEQGTRQQ